MTRYRIVREPARIPVPGGKVIDELFGLVNTGTDEFSLAHMVAPAGWTEPAQTPTFGELTIMVRGALTIEIGDAGDPDSVDTVVLEAGHALWVEPDVTVRYANRSDAPCEYFALCMPAFHPDRARRAPE